MVVSGDSLFILSGYSVPFLLDQQVQNLGKDGLSDSVLFKTVRVMAYLFSYGLVMAYVTSSYFSDYQWNRWLHHSYVFLYNMIVHISGRRTTSFTTSPRLHKAIKLRAKTRLKWAASCSGNFVIQRMHNSELESRLKSGRSACLGTRLRVAVLHRLSNQISDIRCDIFKSGLKRDILVTGSWNILCHKLIIAWRIWIRMEIGQKTVEQFWSQWYVFPDHLKPGGADFGKYYNHRNAGSSTHSRFSESTS